MMKEDTITITDEDLLRKLPAGFKVPAGYAIVKMNQCTRCGYHWVSKIFIEHNEKGQLVLRSEKPNTCSNQECRSPYWDKARVRDLKEGRKMKPKPVKEKS